jgi:hypothetical protein
MHNPREQASLPFLLLLLETSRPRTLTDLSDSYLGDIVRPGHKRWQATGSLCTQLGTKRQIIGHSFEGLSSTCRV